MGVLAGIVPLQLLQRVAPRDVTSVFYHAFAAGPIPHITPLYPCKRIEEFERDLVYLKSRFRLVGHDDVAAHRAGRGSLPPMAASLSFDDGFVECDSLVRPLLLKYGVPATFFVCEGFVDNRALMYRNKVALCVTRLTEAAPEQARELTRRLHGRLALPAGSSLKAVLQALLDLGYADQDAIDEVCECIGVDVAAYLRDRRPYMTRTQIARLHADGFTIGAHTSDHPQLGRLAEWAEVRRQVAGSCRAVREITGRTRVPFAFPFNGIELPRARLESLRDELGCIDLMYDTNDLMKDRPFIVNRISCDAPGRAPAGGSNLPALLWRAHALEPLRVLKRRLSGLPR